MPGFLRDRFLGLLLGAHEQDRAAERDGVAHEGVGLLDACDRLLEVDDVDAVALSEDESLHLGVPTTRLVAEMNAGLQQLLHGHDCGHAGTTSSVRLCSRR
jgi:hypothetical protein